MMKKVQKWQEIHGRQCQLLEKTKSAITEPAIPIPEYKFHINDGESKRNKRKRLKTEESNNKRRKMWKNFFGKCNKLILKKIICNSLFWKNEKKKKNSSVIFSFLKYHVFIKKNSNYPKLLYLGYLPHLYHLCQYNQDRYDYFQMLV